jgi:hypothetical protein
LSYFLDLLKEKSLEGDFELMIEITHLIPKSFVFGKSAKGLVEIFLIVTNEELNSFVNLKAVFEGFDELF